MVSASLTCIMLPELRFSLCSFEILAAKKVQEEQSHRVTENSSYSSFHVCPSLHGEWSPAEWNSEKKKSLDFMKRNGEPEGRLHQGSPAGWQHSEILPSNQCYCSKASQPPEQRQCALHISNACRGFNYHQIRSIYPKPMAADPTPEMPSERNNAHMSISGLHNLPLSFLTSPPQSFRFSICLFLLRTQKSLFWSCFNETKTDEPVQWAPGVCSNSRK